MSTAHKNAQWCVPSIRSLHIRTMELLRNPIGNCHLHRVDGKLITMITEQVLFFINNVDRETNCIYSSNKTENRRSKRFVWPWRVTRHVTLSHKVGRVFISSVRVFIYFATSQLAVPFTTLCELPFHVCCVDHIYRCERL